ncbi:mRNA interferase YafQ [hydrothermal vent metagenome]|uniref:mRNA interferase YafQ n=1 Tax=hydrothermal vent metagenome TaxID=652676 RepID=A0A3B0XLC1_9ZZZZ
MNLGLTGEWKDFRDCHIKPDLVLIYRKPSDFEAFFYIILLYTSMTYIIVIMVILETPVFTRQITALISDDSYAELQQAIRLEPESGNIISGSGGLRKIRWKAEGRGKRGGIRVIYYWYVPGEQIYMLLAYAKNQQTDLSPEQKQVLKQLVEEEFSNGR